MTADMNFEGIEKLWQRQETMQPARQFIGYETEDFLRQIRQVERQQRNSYMTRIAGTLFGLGLITLAIYFFATHPASAVMAFLATSLSLFLLLGLARITHIPLRTGSVHIPLHDYLDSLARRLNRRRQLIQYWLPVVHAMQFIAALAVLPAVIPDYSTYLVFRKMRPVMPSPAELWLLYVGPIFILGIIMVTTIVRRRRDFARDEMPLLARAEQLLGELEREIDS